jgi:hypothetical protein
VPPKAHEFAIISELTQRYPLKASVLLEPTHKIPAIVPDPGQDHFGGIPRVKQHKLWLTLEPIPGITEQL